jgi:hypothetical protein
VRWLPQHNQLIASVKPRRSEGCDLPENDKIIAEIPKNSQETIRVTIGTFNNRPIAGLRVWFRAEDGSWRPSRSGIAFHVRLLPQLSEALLNAVNEARQQGLLSDASDGQ